MTAKSPASAETLTDVAYLRTFTKHLAPTHLRLVAALNGFPSDPREDFDFCELGSGNGDTSVTLAVAHPEARFLGVDLNPTHVEFAKGLAERGGVNNVRFVARDFEDLLHEETPAFDFLAAHGLLSWISPQKRAAFAKVAGAKVKPGGLVYVSYNALPGWSAIEPLRRLMVDGTAGGETDTLDRARRGLALAKLLEENQAQYFAGNPAAKTMLDAMGKSGLPYVAHEYFTPHWHPMYFADVAHQMAAEGLYYVGQFPLYLNYADLALPRGLIKAFEGLTDRLVYESLKDYAVNEFFRRDVYVKGVVPRSAEVTRAYLDRTPFATVVTAALDRELQLPNYLIKLDSPVFDVILPALAERPRTAAELAAMPELAQHGAQKVRDAITHLLFGEQVAVVRPGTPPLGPPRRGRLRVAATYNKMALEQLLGGESTVVLASPAVGTGIAVSTLAAVSIRVLTEVEPAHRAAWIRGFIARLPFEVKVGERTVTDPEERARVVEQEVAIFEEHRAPKLVQLGVLAWDA